MNARKTSLAVAGALMAAGLFGMGGSIGHVQQTNEPLMPWSPKGKTKPKQGTSKPLRGYYGRYSHVLTEYVTDKNRAKQANKHGFKGFRKVRKFIPSGNHEGHPNRGMSVWVRA